MSYFDFIKESVSNIRTVGTVTRSSKFVSKKMIEEADIANAGIVVELGAGDGAITKHILSNMKNPEAKLIAFELNPQFVERLRSIDDPRLVVIDKDVMEINKIFDEMGIKGVDHIISAIPFVVFPEEKAEEAINTCKKVMNKGGRFIQLHYSLVLKKMYERLFHRVEVNFVLRNMPPAWVLTCYL